MWKLCRIYQSSILWTLAPIIGSSWITHMFNGTITPQFTFCNGAAATFSQCTISPPMAHLYLLCCALTYWRTQICLLCHEALASLLCCCHTHFIDPGDKLPVFLCLFFTELSSLTLWFSCPLGECPLSETCAFPVKNLTHSQDISYLHLRITNLDVKLWFHTWHLQNLILERPLKYTYSYRGWK